MQNQDARIVINQNRFCHITPVLKDRHWLPIQYIIIELLLLTMHISDLFIFAHHYLNLDLRNLLIQSVDDLCSCGKDPEHGSSKVCLNMLCLSKRVNRIWEEVIPHLIKF